MRGRGRAATVLAGGGALLALAWGLGPRSAPPLYDSGPIVAEPYRYFHPPAGYTATKPPSTVDMTLKLESGQSPAMAEITDEQPAQAQLLAPQQAFAVPPGAASVRVTIAPVDPPAVAPSDGRLDGNVYRFAVTAGAAPLPLRPGQQVTVVLRGPAGAPNAMLELWDGSRWTRLDSQPLGNTAPDSYAANVTMLGDFALVVSNAVSGGDNAGSGGGAGLLVAVIVIALAAAAAATVLVLRRR